MILGNLDNNLEEEKSTTFIDLFGPFTVLVFAIILVGYFAVLKAGVRDYPTGECWSQLG